MKALAAEAMSAEQEAEGGKPAGAEPGLLRQFEPGQLLGVPGDPTGEGTLRKRPAPAPYRIPVLLHQAEPVPVGRDDDRKVRLVHDRVAAAAAVSPLDLIPAQHHPGVLVDEAGGDGADVRLARSRVGHPGSWSRRLRRAGRPGALRCSRRSRGAGRTWTWPRRPA